MNLPNKLTEVSCITSIIIFSSWGKVNPLKPLSPFSAAVRLDGLFGTTDQTRFHVLRFIPARRGVNFDEMIRRSLNVLVVFCILSYPDLLSSFSISRFFSDQDFLGAVVDVAVVPSMDWGYPIFQIFI